MAAISDLKVSQVLCSDTKLTAHLSLKGTGNIDVQIYNPNIKQKSTLDTAYISTTATECSWNVYSAVKCPTSTQVSNRSSIVETISDGQMIRIGSAIFLPQSSTSSASFKSFTVPKMSLYIDSIKQHGPYLFVTSRQDVTTIPEPKDKPEKDTKGKANNTALKSKDDGTDTKTSSETVTEPLTAQADSATKNKPEDTKAADSSDDDNSADDLPQPSDDDSSNELSADESWSERSTDYDSDQKLRDFNPRMPRQEKLKMRSNSNESGSESNSDSATSDDSDLEENLLEGSDKEGAAMSSDEEDRFFVQIFNDGDDPQEEEDDERSEVDAEDDDYPEFDDWNRNDWVQQGGSDSEDCSECGDDGGACVMPPKDLPTAAKNDEAEEVEEPIGTPVAHVHMYDTTGAFEGQDELKRVFHFKRPTGQILAASPPAIHPNKSLMVWPLGDGKILFADYENNTYFVRKFQTSQFWSSHVSINCNFSEDGKHLNVVALEKSGKPPTPPMRKSKAKSKGKEEVPKPKKDMPKYELIVSTYRMSDSKTTRAPPMLIKRVQRDLGELDVLPTVSWKDYQVYVSLTRKTTAYVYRVDLQNVSTTKMRRSKADEMIMHLFAVDLPEWAAKREVQFIRSDNDPQSGQLIIKAEPTKLPAYKPAPDEGSVDSLKIPTAEELSTKKSNSLDDPATKPEAKGSEEHNERDEASAEDIPNAGTKTLKEDVKETSEKQATPKSIHPGTMVAYISSDKIEASGGWRDAQVVAATESKGDEKSAMTVELKFEAVLSDG